MKKIAILGCGWLGLPLAKSLLDKGYAVKGSTTSVEKISLLKEVGIDAYQIEISENNIDGPIASFLDNSEILIIDIPPKLRGNQTENFVKKIENIIPFIIKSRVEKVIFVSSTSVYPDLLLENKDQNIITEETKPEPTLENGKQLVEAENHLKKNSNFRTTILRFGGLIGENRQPIRSLSGKTKLLNLGSPINLIHQIDCIGIIEAIIEKDIWNETFNAVAPFHPSRKEYYTQKAVELELPIPEFESSSSNLGKTISGAKVETVLHYIFKKPNL
ncbi:SDR family NAD(P)-dependent oxidoreductase [Flavobacterium sp.]